MSSSSEKEDQDREDGVLLDSDEPQAQDDKKEKGKGEEGGLKKELSLFNSVTFVVGSIVGSGIYITASNTVKYSGSIGLSLVMWLLGSLVAVAGGLSYMEIATLIPSSGGDYAYLREMYSFGRRGERKRERHGEEETRGEMDLTIKDEEGGGFFVTFGSLLGFLFGWSTVVLIRPASNAVQLLTFGKYFSHALLLVGGIWGGATSELVTILAVISGIILTLINIFSVKLTAHIMNISGIAKISCMIFISCIGIWTYAKGDYSDNFDNVFDGTSTCIGDISLALYSVLWTYDGWNSLIYTVEETKNAEKNLPKGILIGVPIVTVCYLFVNWSYYISLINKHEILSSEATALTLGNVTLGSIGVLLISVSVSISTLGTGLIGMYSGSRVAYVLARDGSLMNAFSGLHNQWNTPIQAILLQSILTLLYVLVGNIGHIINGLSPVMWLFYCLSFIGLLIMRYTKRNIKRPFKVWTPVPMVMICSALFLITVPLVFVSVERWYILLGLILVLTGAPVYLLLVHNKYRPAVFTRISSMITDVSNKIFYTSSFNNTEDITIEYSYK